MCREQPAPPLAQERRLLRVRIRARDHGELGAAPLSRSPNSSSARARFARHATSSGASATAIRP
jgi:hypothetical protein